MSNPKTVQDFCREVAEKRWPKKEYLRDWFVNDHCSHPAVPEAAELYARHRVEEARERNMFTNISDRINELKDEGEDITSINIEFRNGSMIYHIELQNPELPKTETE